MTCNHQPTPHFFLQIIFCYKICLCAILWLYDYDTLGKPHSTIYHCLIMCILVIRKTTRVSVPGAHSHHMQIHTACNTTMSWTPHLLNLKTPPWSPKITDRWSSGVPCEHFEILCFERYEEGRVKILNSFFTKI